MSQSRSTWRTGAGEAKPKTKLAHAMLIGHPCSLRGGANLATLQNIAEVRPIKDAEKERFKEPWDTNLKLFPLVDFADGDLWVADFNVFGTVHFKLLENKRVACLSLEGWAAMQRRYAMHSLRIDQSIALRVADIRPQWNELTVWEECCSRGYSDEFFEEWKREPIKTDGPYKGTLRLDAFEFAADVILAELPDPAQA